MVCSKPCWLICPVLLLWWWLVLCLFLLLLWGKILVIPLWRRIRFSLLANDGVKILVEILLKINICLLWVAGGPLCLLRAGGLLAILVGRLS